MTNEELERKAFEYRLEVVPETYLGYPDVEIPMYSALDIDWAYIAGAKEMQKENEQLKQLLEKLKHCDSCKHSCYLSQSSYALICKFSNYFCGKACDKWKLKEWN